LKNKLVKDHICLEKGVYYNPTKDSYLFTTRSDTDIGPISLGFQVTRKCNLNCIHCCESEKIPDSSLLKIKKIAKKLREDGRKRICITGGEPLCRTDIKDIIKIFYDQGMFLTLSTNGLNVTNEILNFAKKYIVNIRFSLHGLEKTHDRVVRQKGAFKKTIEAIELSIKKNIHVGVIFSVLRINSDEIIDVARLCEKIGVEKFIIFSLIARGRARKIFDKQFIHVSEIRSIMEKINKIKKKENWNLEVNLVDWRVEGQCILVFPDGTMIGTPSFKSPKNTFILGNVLKEDIKKMWDKYPFKQNYVSYYKFH
jgi:MoaA/NifB/PqqE/SkfB family radical SAM enzyme